MTGARPAALLLTLLGALLFAGPRAAAQPAYASAPSAPAETARTAWVGPVNGATLTVKPAAGVPHGHASVVDGTAPSTSVAGTAAPRPAAVAPAVTANSTPSPLGLMSKSSVPTGGQASSATDSSVAQSGSVVFYTGDWFAAYSSDGGATWTSIDPTAALPAPYGSVFCCRQRVIYDPSQDIFVWTLQYSSSVSATAPNVERVAVAHGGIGVLHRAWSYFDIHPSDIGPWNDWIDYPSVALTAGHLFLSADLFSGSGAWDRSVVLRFGLPALASAVTGSSLEMESFVTTLAFHLAAAQGATSTMYFASDRFCDAGTGAGPQPAACVSPGGVQYVNSLRVYGWPDSAGAAAIDGQYVATSNVPYGASTCNPGGPELCAADDHRVLAGFSSGSTIGFIYDAAQDPVGAVAAGPRPYPYLQVTRINVSATTWSEIDEPSLYSTSASWWGGGAAANIRGDVAVAAYTNSVGPSGQSTDVAGLASGSSAWSTPVVLASSSATPPPYPAGTSLTVRPAFPWSETFAATGAVVTSSCSSAATPCSGAGALFARFGRASDLAGGQMIPVTPTRIMDTRSGGYQVGPFSTPVGPGETRSMAVAGLSPIPSTGVTGVVLDVGVTDTTAYSYLTVFPGGSAPPLASNLNWSPGQTLANLVEVNLGPAGDVSYYNSSGSVDVFFDVVGFVTADTSSYGTEGLLNPIQPVRYLDTRTDVGGHHAQLGPGQTLKLQVAGAVPAGSGATAPPVPGPGNSTAASVVLNLTEVGLNGSAVGASYLSVYPSDAAAGTAQQTSELNFSNRDIRGNRVLVKLGLDGAVVIYNSQGYVDVIVDVGGWFSSPVTAQGAHFHAQPPRRILDTRPASRIGSLGSFGPQQVQPVQVAYLDSIPATAAAVALNVTITDATAGSYLTVAPQLAAVPPSSSDLNWPPGDTRPNNDLVAVNQASNPGTAAIYNDQGSVDVVVDVVGWFGNP